MDVNIICKLYIALQYESFISIVGVQRCGILNSWCFWTADVSVSFINSSPDCVALQLKLQKEIWCSEFLLYCIAGVYKEKFAPAKLGKCKGDSFLQ
jgi:hypothetical protein